MSDERNIHAADDYDKAGQIYSYAFGADGHVVADDETISWRWTGFALSDARARAAASRLADAGRSRRRTLSRICSRRPVSDIVAFVTGVGTGAPAASNA